MAVLYDVKRFENSPLPHYPHLIFQFGEPFVCTSLPPALKSLTIEGSAPVIFKIAEFPHTLVHLEINNPAVESIPWSPAVGLRALFLTSHSLKRFPLLPACLQILHMHGMTCEVPDITVRLDNLICDFCPVVTYCKKLICKMPPVRFPKGLIDLSINAPKGVKIGSIPDLPNTLVYAEIDGVSVIPQLPGEMRILKIVGAAVLPSRLPRALVKCHLRHVTDRHTPVFPNSIKELRIKQCSFKLPSKLPSKCDVFDYQGIDSRIPELPDSLQHLAVVGNMGAAWSKVIYFPHIPLSLKILAIDAGECTWEDRKFHRINHIEATIQTIGSMPTIDLDTLVTVIRGGEWLKHDQIEELQARYLMKKCNERMDVLRKELVASACARVPGLLGSEVAGGRAQVPRSLL